MLRKISWVVLIGCGLMSVNAQKTKPNSPDRPKLVVGLVVDQMRWDYLYRFESKFGEGGFKRMLGEGYSFNNVHINYLPTVTAIGHASIYTGSVPSIHGIAGNNWTDKVTGKDVYCTSDGSVLPLGSTTVKNGQHSPKNLWSTTITDQLRLATNFRSKVVGVSLKDRASILPAGHNPTAAYWYDDVTGNFMTSTYYMQNIPTWVDEFNQQKYPDQLVAKGWNTLLPIKEYTQSSRDNVEWESLLGSAKTPTFPYNNLAADMKTKKGLIRTTPFGNTLTLKFATTTLDNYQLGRGTDTDFLAINLASTDYVGHSFGPNSVEIEDTYLRLDRDLEAFFKDLDAKVGKNNYLVFLSADHGGAHSVGFLEENKMPTGFYGENLDKTLNTEVEKKFGIANAILDINNYQIYINEKSFENKTIVLDDVKNYIVKLLTNDPNVLYAFDLSKANQASIPEPIKSRAINGFNWKRSGDIQYVTKDGIMAHYAKKGTTHSVWNSYDAHIPLVFMGWNIKNGESNNAYNMTDIAPTLAALLHIQFPSGTIGNPIPEVFEKK